MSKRRVVERASTGERYIESSHLMWQQDIAACLADPSKPQPMPDGHRMFRFPDEYGCRIVPRPDDVLEMPLGEQSGGRAVIVEAAREAARMLGTDPDAVHVQWARSEPSPPSTGSSAEARNA